MATNGFVHQRNAHQHRNANAGTTTLKRRSDDNRDYSGGIRGYQEERNRYAPPQKRFRSQTTQTQTQFQSGKKKIPLYHHHHRLGSNNMSRVSESYNYGNDDVMIASNSSFALRNKDSHTNNYQKPFVVGYGNPNPQIVPLPLPYRKLDVSMDYLPEWAPNETLTPNLPIRSENFVANTITQAQPPVFTNIPNSLPLNHHSNMVSVVSQSMSQPIFVGKDLSDLLSILNNVKEKQNSVLASKSDDESSSSLPRGLSFDDPSLLRVRHESVINSLYSDMPRQCSSCGVRFKCQEDHSKHMDWHVRKNRTAKTSSRLSQKPKKYRDWFASEALWLIAATRGTMEAAKACFGETLKKKEEEEAEQQQEHLVPADEDQKNCALCEEAFEEFFSHEADDWMYKDAVYLNKNGPIVHVKCMPEPRHIKESREPPSRVMSLTVPSVASAIVC